MSCADGEISEAEAQLYDRQIRLWGLDAQKRLRSARILIIGMRGLGCEVAKNLVLAGVKSLLALDNGKVDEKDACSQFLAPRDKVGQNRAEASKERLQRLNPMVDVRADQSSIADKDDEFFKDFDIVCASGLSPEEYIRINECCREKQVKFFCGDVSGSFGYCFADLLKHVFVEEVRVTEEKQDSKAKTNSEPATVMEKKEIQFVSLKNALKTELKESARKIKRMDPAFFILRMLHNFYTTHGTYPLPEKRDEHIKFLHKSKEQIISEYDLPHDKIPDSVIPMLFGELAPVAAIVGGVLGQEVIKAISNKDAPHDNFFIYNPVGSSGVIECMKG